MAMDAGSVTFTFPAQGQATAAALAVVGNVTSTGDKAFWNITEPLDIVEVGAFIGTATDADTYAFKFSLAPNIGGSFTDFATVTGPAATIIASGSCVRKYVTQRANKGDVLRVNVTDAAGAGTAQFYVKAYPAGQGQRETGDVASTT